jgi:hypothetical protein
MRRLVADGLRHALAILMVFFLESLWS